MLKDKLHDLGILCKDIVLRDWMLSLKEYRPFLFKFRKNPRYIFMIDGKRNHGGMFDRLKGLVSIYAVAKAQDVDFKVLFIWPFHLDKYLEPNKYDWVISKKDIIKYRYPASRPVIAYGETNHPYRLMKKRKGETHFYYGFDILDKINQKYNKKYKWGELYHELFKPTAYLQKYLDAYQKDIGSEYIAVHIRIMNLLGDKVELYGNRVILSSEVQHTLKEQLKEVISKIEAENPNKRILLATDSNHFVNYILPFFRSIYVVPGSIKHIDTASGTEDVENIKLFLDYYLIAGAEKVYSIVSDDLYLSAFPEYSAKINNIPFKRIEL